MEDKYLIIRGDDLGVTHAANQGFRRYAEQGVMSAWSIMAPCPWFNEAVELAKEFPEVDLGIHLTLMSEWKGYRWAPILGAERVPTLVDSDGYFYANPIKFALANPKKEEIEAELRAQVDRVIKAGLNLRYVDNSHGNICHMIPIVNEVANQIIEDYNLEASPFVFDPTLEIISRSPATSEAKLEAYTKWLKTPPVTPGYRFVVVHPMEDMPEARALKLHADLEVPFLNEIIFHNIADTKAVATEEFKKEMKKQGYKLLRYRDMEEAQHIHHLTVWPAEIVSQMFSMMGASPEVIQEVLKTNR